MNRNSWRLLLIITIVVVGSAAVGWLIVTSYLRRTTAVLPSALVISPTQIPQAKPSEKIISPLSSAPVPSVAVTATPSGVIAVTLSVSPNLTPTIVKTEEGFIFPQSESVVIKESQLVELTPWQLKVARNEIYARHGRAFVHKDLQCYFQKLSWYTIDSGFKDTDLNEIEKRNVQTIQDYEQKIESPLANHDGGC